MDCHWYSEFMLKRWRMPNGRVTYYDIELGRLREWKTGKLFTLPDINTPEVEGELNRLESVVARCFDVLVEGTQDERIAVLEDAEIARALSLLLVLQFQRTLEAKSGPEDGFSLGETLGKGSEFLNGLVTVFERKNQMGVAPVPKTHRLFLPDTGFFLFPLPDPRVGVALAFGMPLAPTTLLVAIPRPLRVNWKEAGPWVSGLSIGRAVNMKRIVIPPEYLDAIHRDQLIAMINDNRARADKLFNDVAKVRELAGEMYRIAGLPPPTGR